MAEWLLQEPRETALPYEAIVILAIVVLNALLGYVQEARAEKSVRALMALAAPEATVVRDGERRRVATHEIVPGDIVMIEAGDKIPADARIIESANLRTDEAPLTGESTPVAKETQAIDADVGLGDRRNMLFASTVATYGRGRAVVVSTGMATEVGRIAGLLEATEVEPTPLQQELDRTGKRLSIIMLGICAIVFVTGLLGASAFSLDVILGLFLFAVALAVAAIPEALPAIVTVGLSIGVRRMAATNAIVRKLPAVETLGAATVICSDKTGTLTRNEMTIRAIFTAGSAGRGRRQRLHPGGRLHRRRCDACRSVARTRCRGANPPCCRARQRCVAHREPRRLVGARRSDRGRPGRCGTQVRHIGGRARAPSPHCGDPVHVGAQAPRDRSCRSRQARRTLCLRQGCARGPDLEVPVGMGRRQGGHPRRGPPGGARAAQRSPGGPGAADLGHRRAHRAGGRPGSRSRSRRRPHVFDRASRQHRGRPHAARPGRHDRSSPAGGEGGRCRRPAGPHPHRDDHGRPPGDRPGNRRRAGHLRAGGSPRDRRRLAHHGRCRARRDRRAGPRVRPRRSRSTSSGSSAPCSERVTSSP